MMRKSGRMRDRNTNVKRHWPQDYRQWHIVIADDDYHLLHRVTDRMRKVHRIKLAQLGEFDL